MRISEERMAVALNTSMTLGQQTKMYNVIQQGQHHPQAKPTVIQGKRPLAPAPERTASVLVTTAGAAPDLRCKRKIQFVPYGQPPQQPASVARRNARERNRVKQVNNGFATLRQHIPASVAAAFAPQAAGGGGAASGRGASKKLSKVETLRLAVEYIRSLQQMIEDHEQEMINSGSENGGYYAGSPDSLTQQFTASYPLLLPTPACSEASASPTPSHSSEGSISATSTYTPTALYHQQDAYETYDPKSPEDDDELLDAIFSWQQE